MEAAEELRMALEGDVNVLSSLRKEFESQMAENDRMAVEDIRPLLENRRKKFVDAALSKLF